jgi:hypothetical protein
VDEEELNKEIESYCDILSHLNIFRQEDELEKLPEV